MAEINVGKFINNLDTEDLTSEKLQGVVNNTYAKAITTHKKATKKAEDNLKDTEKETVEFTKSNHDRLKANNADAKKLNKDNAKEVKPAGKTAKGVEETKGSAVVESKKLKEDSLRKYNSWQITNGDLTDTVSQVGEYAYVIQHPNGRYVKNARIDKSRGSDDRLFTLDQVDAYQRGMNMWVVDKSMGESKGLNTKRPIRKKLNEEKEEYSFEEIIDMMASAEEYEDLYYAAGLIKNVELRADVEELIDSCEQDEDDVDTAYSIVTSDLLDNKVNELNVKFLSSDHLNLDDLRAQGGVERVGEEAWKAACAGDTEWVEKIFNDGHLQPNEFRYKKFGERHSLIMGALRNGQFETAEALKSLGEKILKSEVDEYKSIMAKKTYSDETSDGAVDESKKINEKLDLYVNGKYICSSDKYKTAKEFKDKVLKDGSIKYAGEKTLKRSSSTPLDTLKITPDDKIVVKKSVNESRTPYGDTTIEDYVNANFVGDKKLKDKLIANIKKKANGKDYFNGLNMSVKDWEKAGNECGLTMKKFTVESKKVNEVRTSKTKEIKVLQGNYGYGWDDLVTYDKSEYSEIKKDYRDYKENEPQYRHRVVTRRVPIEESKKLKENKEPTIEAIRKFLEDSIRELKEDQDLTARYVLDDDLCLYVGYEPGFDKDENGSEYRICSKIAERNDFYWVDMEANNMPWNPETGDVWDTDTEANPNDAGWYVKEYKEIRKALDNGELVLESKKSKGGKKLREADGKNMTIETSTSILDMFYPTLYETTNDFYIDDYKRLDDILAKVSMKYVEEAFEEVFPNATIKFKEVRHPREYNFSGENIIFDVTLPKADYEKVKEEVMRDPGFKQFLKKNSPRSGYIPFGAYDLDKFETQDPMYSIGQIVKYKADREDLDSEFFEDFRDELYSNFETYDDLWEETMEWLQEHDQAYEDFKDHFNVTDDQVVDLDSIFGWISEHDTLAQDFENRFGISLGESLSKPKKLKEDKNSIIGKSVFMSDGSRYRFGGIITKIENGLVYLNDETNPRGYQLYTVKEDKFNKWVNDGLYKLRKSNHHLVDETGKEYRIAESKESFIKESIKERYTDKRKQAAYENACDCIIYGYGKSYWNSLDLTDEEKTKVWKQAYNDLAEDESLIKEDTNLDKVKEDSKRTAEKVSKEAKEFGDDLKKKADKILALLKNGKITAEEASQKIKKLADEVDTFKGTILKKYFTESVKLIERLEPEELNKIFAVGKEFVLTRPLELRHYIGDDYFDLDDDDYDDEDNLIIRPEKLEELKNKFIQELKEDERFDQGVIDNYVVVDKDLGDIKLELPKGTKLVVKENEPNTTIFNGNPWFTRVKFTTPNGDFETFYNDPGLFSLIAKYSKKITEGRGALLDESPLEARFEVYGYYDAALRGVAEFFETDRWSEVEDTAHQYLSDGDFVTITDTKTGRWIKINPDVYFEDFEGEFPVSYRLEHDVW